MKKKPAPVARKKSFSWLYLLIVVLAAAATLTIFLSQKPKTASLPAEVSVSQAYDLYQKGTFILDVREQSEWDVVHIPGATLVPLGDLPNSLGAVPKDAEVVIVCRSGNRSAQGRDTLKAAGYTLVTSMAGGMNQWQAAGYPTESGP